MQCYNFINFIRIVDISLLNFIDYSDLIQDSYIINEQGKLCFNLNAKNKKIITGFIINNINDAIQYGKQNIIVDTCTPMQNWRQVERTKAVRSYKYCVGDESIYIDEIKLNQFLNKLFKRLPILNTKLLKDYSIENFKVRSIQNRIKCIEFDELDVHDAFTILGRFLSNIGILTFDSLTYNIIRDGNYVYEHNSSFPDNILQNVRLQLLQKGIL